MFWKTHPWGTHEESSNIFQKRADLTGKMGYGPQIFTHKPARSQPHTGLGAGSPEMFWKGKEGRVVKHMVEIRFSFMPNRW